MGRPLNKKYFANRDVGGAGGDTVTSVPVTTAGTLYSQGLTATLSAPNIADGVQATITPVVNSTTGAVTSFTVTNAGSGYTSAPTVTLVKPTTQTATAVTITDSTHIILNGVNSIYVGMTVTDTTTAGNITAGTTVIAVNTTTKTVTLSAATTIAPNNVLSFADAGSSFVAGTVIIAAQTYTGIRPQVYDSQLRTSGNDIIKQEASRRYKVASAGAPTGAYYTLVAATPAAAGQMAIVATDFNGSTYWVTKLTAHKALLTQNTMSGSYQFASDTQVPWTFGSAVTGYSVTITNV